MDNVMTITDESGQEKEVEILLTFESDEGRKFVLFTDPSDTLGRVYAYTYNDDGEMDEVTDENDWQMCEEVLGAFMDEVDDNER